MKFSYSKDRDYGKFDYRLHFDIDNDDNNNEDDVLNTSIIEGVSSGIMFETQAYLDSKPENMAVFTGGDANYFANKMKNSIFVIWNLVLMGLALIAHEYEKRLLQ